MIKILTVFSILFLYACSNTSPTNVKTSDVQKVTAVEYGIIKSASPIKIKGESNWIGATAGAMIGGLLGTAVCGEEEIVGTKCQDIAVVFGTIGGAAIGSVTQAKLGDHDGFQYIIDIDNNENDSAIVQGDKNSLKDGQKVVIIYGNDIRVLPYEEE
jgi:outer membrane lipoprotein SlyB